MFAHINGVNTYTRYALSAERKDNYAKNFYGIYSARGDGFYRRVFICLQRLFGLPYIALVCESARKRVDEIRVVYYVFQSGRER